ncbi:MAG: phosphoglycerate dehydrogenase [Acutalibacteraceae bacterium]
MYNIKTLNKISKVGLSQFDETKYTYADEIENPDAILVRSASMHDMDLPESVKAIARAGAGTNNIPCDKCAEQGIVVFNTPGANANAVKELVIAGLLLSSRKVVPGIEWAKTLKGEGDQVGKLVEKGKSAFAGPEIMGKTLGVIGLGAIGVLVANAAEKLGMTVYGYDPFLSVNAAWNLSRNVKHSTSLDEIFANCDYITIHVPLNDDTKNTVNAETIAKMKDGVRILNFARGGLVDSDAIIKALEEGKVASYVVDFPDEKVLDVDGVIAIPHLGASTPESEENCAYMAANEIIAYLEKGSIINSVNMPNVDLGDVNGARVCVIHKNVTNMIAQISACFSNAGLNIDKLVNNSRGDYAYTVVDLASVSDEAVAKIKEIEAVISVRVIKE